MGVCKTEMWLLDRLLFRRTSSLPGNEEKISSRSFQKFPCCVLALLYTPHLTIDFFFIRENNAAFASSTTSRKEDTADDPSSNRQRHFEGEICFPGMFYDLLFKMLALFEGLADSGDSTYK